MQENLKKKWCVTDAELKAAREELCAKGAGRGYYQSTRVLLALLDVLTAGDIPAQAENDEAEHARAGESAPASDEKKSERDELFFDMIQKSEEEIAAMFNSGMFNGIAVGYGKIALEAMGLTSKSLVAFEKEMKYAFDEHDAEEALKVYNRLEGGV